ncbi:Sensor histidine kinase DesK [Halioglobus japonicus]|nr:Sensor histidine kinase DesK [Halioglobus japonicus]
MSSIRLRLTLALLVPVLLFFCGVIGALSLPQADASFHADGQTLQITTMAGGQASPLSHFTIGDAATIEASPDLVIEEPDVVPTYAAMHSLFGRIGDLTAALSSGELVAITTAGDKISLHLEPRSLRDLPGVYWLQILCATTALVVCALIWSTVKFSLGSLGFILSGAGFALAAVAASIYSTRSLFIEADYFYFLSVMNGMGAILFGSGLILFLWNYPLPLWPRFSKCLALFSFTAFNILNVSEVVQDISIARYLPMPVMLVIALVGLVLQWVNTHNKAAERLIVRWIAVSVVLGTSIFILSVALPIVLGFSEPAPQSLTIATFLLMYLSIMLAVVRYRLFDLERWYLAIWAWMFGGLAVLAADLVLASLLSLSSAATLTLSLAVVGWIYFPLRQWLWKRFFQREGKGLEQWLETSLPVMLQANLSGQSEVSVLKQVAEAVFSPLDVDEIPDTYPRVEASKNGDCLFIPLTSGGSLRMSHAAQGRRLFSERDTAQAKFILALYQLTTSSVTARQEGAQQERQRMKRDLHDDLGAKLLQLLHRSERSNQPLVREAIADLRNLLRNRPTENKNTLRAVNGWREEAEVRCKDHQIKLDWQQEVVPAPINAKSFDNITSVLRESLSNAVRHASDKSVRIRINGDPEELKIVVTNQFHGGQQCEGNGLENIRNRMLDAGGVCAISQNDKEWQVRLAVTLRD